jgi:hypothetical protein
MDAAQTPLPPPGARTRSGPFAQGGACGEVARASTHGATASLQPTGPTLVSSPVVSNLVVRSATNSRPEPRCRQSAFGPWPRCLFSSVARWSRTTLRSPGARLEAVPRPPLMSGRSSPQAARDAGCATNWPGVAARHGPPLASDGPGWHKLRPSPGPGRLAQALSGYVSAISPDPAWLARAPVWLGAVDRR